MERMDVNSDNDGENNNTLEVSINYKGVDILFEVDYETASQLLNDHELAQKYAEEMLASQEGETDNSNSKNNLSVNDTSSPSASNTCSSNIMMWSSKSNANKDYDATVLFLQLRKKYATKFDDRKTIKNSLWQKISEEMNSAGFYVGMGKEGAEKCRQKFANLQRTYMAHVTHMRRTGEAKKEPPPHFDELHDILGSKCPLVIQKILHRAHQVHPKLIVITAHQVMRKVMRVPVPKIKKK